MSRTDRAGRRLPFRVKICCIADAGEAAMATEAHLLGLVGPMPSGPGVVTLAEAREIAAAVVPPPEPVLLTAGQTAAEIVADATAAGVRAVQVVRHIAAAEAERLDAAPLTVLQVVHVEGPEALDLIPVYAPHCDAFLLDSGRPSEGALGGTGRVHDWKVSAAFVARSPRPVFLAGGLDPGNAREAVRQVRPDGLDVCSGLRPEGRLDKGRLAAFLSAARNAAEALA